MLADRLLSKGDYECDRELRTLELLKARSSPRDAGAGADGPVCVGAHASVNAMRGRCGPADCDLHQSS